MNKNDYLAALTRALADLPDDTTASVIADYARRFDAAVAAGQSEEEVARSMPNPGTVASTWWSTARGTSNQSRFDVAAFTSTMPPLPQAAPRPAGGGVARVLSTALGLAVLNLFMLIPAIVYGAIMTAALVVTLAVYGAGVVVTSSGLAGVDSVLIDKPVLALVAGEHGLTKIKAGQMSGTVNLDAGTVHIRDLHSADGVSVKTGYSNLDFIVGDGSDARGLRIVKGVAAVIAGILALLVWLVLLRYSFVAARHYVALNVAALRGR